MRIILNLTAWNNDKLVEELNVLPFVDGTVFTDGALYAVLRRDSVDEAELESWTTQVRTVEAAHNPALKTAQQLEDEVAANDRMDLRNAVAVRIAEIDVDLAALPAATTAETKQIIARLLRAQQRILKVLRHL